MFIAKEFLRYPTMDALIGGARRTGIHPNSGLPEQISPDSTLSDCLMYVQSNGRAQIGHDAEGRMHYVTCAGERDFSLPTLTWAPDQAISAMPGMYHQADVALMLGKLHFSLRLEDGSVLTSGGPDSTTCYADHFLPMTTTSAQDMALTSFSLAPMLENDALSHLEGLPFPGPGGAIHVLHIKNNSDRIIHCDAVLNLNQGFVSQYQFSYKGMAQHTKRPFQSEWNTNVLFMWRPDACAMVQAQGFSHSGNPGMPNFINKLRLDPGEERTLTCFAVVSTDFSHLRPALSALYRHSALEWVNITASFWADRLGRLTARGDALEQRSMDFTARSTLDSFNCYQFSETGELTVHLQGAPSQISGRFWGIDAEPTALSVLYAVPELAHPILRYVIDRNRPAYSVFKDHSTPIFMAPLIIAAKHYELTADTSIYQADEHLRSRLIEDIRALLAMRHKCGLVPSRYSSDGHVFRRYDFGTNCKAHYAFAGFARVLAALGDGALADGCRAAALEIRRAIVEQMSWDGPFGPQISGGSNLDEAEHPFYLKDDLPYYDGEDSSSCMAPLYGVLGWRDPLWQNYHRFARSLFATNFDAEAKALRWFAWGEAIDGTALISRIGGCTTRADMRDALANMFEMGTDSSESLFWWPRATNYTRGLTRCSQGAGAWVVQHTEQWLGLRIDAERRILTLAPQGLYAGYEWLDARIGAGRFDISAQEHDGAMHVRVANKGSDDYTLSVVPRAEGAAFSGKANATFALPAGGVAVAELECSAPLLGDIDAVSIPAVENAAHAADGPSVGSYLIALPKAYDPEPGIVILPLVVLSGPRALKSATLTVEMPERFMAKPKPPRMLCELTDEGFERIARIGLGDIGPGQRLAHSLYVALPQIHQGDDVWMRGAPFSCLPGQPGMALRGKSNADLGVVTITLAAQTDSGDVKAGYQFPVCALEAEAFDRMRVEMFGGENLGTYPKL